MKEKDFEKITRKFAEDFREYAREKNIDEATGEEETLVFLATNNKMDVNLSILRGSIMSLACIIADKMKDSDYMREAVKTAIKLYYLPIDK